MSQLAVTPPIFRRLLVWSQFFLLDVNASVVNQPFRFYSFEANEIFDIVPNKFDYDWAILFGSLSELSKSCFDYLTPRYVLKISFTVLSY